MPRNSLRHLIGCVLVPAVVVAVCPSASAALSSDDVWLRFDAGPANARVTWVGNVGTSATRQQVVRANGGDVLARRSRTGGMAVDYPAYDGSPAGARAVVAVTNTGAADQLTPGAGRLVFGADVRRDRVSTGRPADNGNNVIQRGLSADVAQFKIQIDNGHASCRVKGDLGVLYLESRAFMRAETWYRLTCVRQVWARGDRLVLTVAPINRNGTPGRPVTSASGVRPVGHTSFGHGTPLSVGGKLEQDLSIDPASDQFNGWIDNAFLRIP